MNIHIKPWMVSVLRFLHIGTLVRKSVPTYFKYASEEDFKSGFVSPGINKPATKGVVETLEGPDTFSVGDIICKGWIKGEFWKLTKKRFDELKITTIEPVNGNWGQCKNKNKARAIKIPFNFTIKQEDGKPLTAIAGNHLLYDENGYWPLAKELYPTTYEKI